MKWSVKYHTSHATTFRTLGLSMLYYTGGDYPLVE